MNIKSLIEKMDLISEGTKETKTGRIHKAEPGGYGRKDDEDSEGKKVQSTVKRGRGRPSTTGAHSQSPEEKEKQAKREKAGKELQSFMVGNLPGGKAPGKKGQVHKIKDESIEESTDVTDYSPKSQGGTREELLAKYKKTKDPKDAAAARKAGATQKELQGVAEGSGGRKFIKPNFDFEWEEAERYPEFVKLGKDAWIELAKKGRAVTITSARGIDNTDAADPDSFKSLVPAKQKRSLAQLEKGTVEMPIVAVYSDGRKELVGGNTRLTAMMARDGQATVWAFRVPGEQGVAEGSEIQVPTEDGITMQDIRLMAGEGKLTQKTIKQAIEIIRRQRKKKQGVAEGEGNFAKAMSTLHGWDRDDSDNPDFEETFYFDDGEGGYYADGIVRHNLETGEITVDFEDKSGDYGGDIKGTFNSIGDAMKALRGTFIARRGGGKAHNYDSLGGRDLAGPEHLYKTDKAGKKGTLTKGRMDQMKMGSRSHMRGGPKGILPEDQGVAEGEGVYRHKGTYGTSYDSDDNEKEKSVVKRGRGRPRKDADVTGHVPNWDTETLSKWIVGSKPKTLPGKPGVKHKLKDWMEHVEARMIVESIVNESRMSEVDILLQDLVNGNADIYDVMNHPRDEVQQYVSKILHKKYEHISSDEGLHPDDDFEAIQSKILDELEREYGDLREGQKTPIAVVQDGRAQQGVLTSTSNDPAVVNTLGAAASIVNTGRGQIQMPSLTPSPETGMNPAAKPGVQEENLEEVAPKGWEKTVKAMKKHKDEIDNPWALSHWMKNKGYKSHKNESTESKAESLMENKLVMLLSKYPHEHTACQEGWGMDEGLYEALSQHYFDEGQIPYKVWHGPLEELRDWVEECYMKDTQELMENPLLAALMPAAARAAGTAFGIKAADKLLDDEVEETKATQLMKPSDRFSDEVPPEPILDPRKVDPRKPSHEIPAFIRKSWEKGVKPTLPENELETSLRDSVAEMEEDYMRESKVNQKYTSNTDAQMESWEKELNSLLQEGMTVTTSTGNEGASDSVSISATDADAQTLMKLLQSAGISGGFDAAQTTDSEEPIQPVSSDEVMTQLSSEKEEDDSGDEEFSFLKRMLGDRGDSVETITVSDQGDDAEEEEEEEEEEDTSERETTSEELKGGQKKLDVAEPKGKLTAADFKELRDEDDSEDDEGSEEDEEKVDESAHEEMCEDCGQYESKCGCDHEKLDEWANSPAGSSKDESFETELDYMTKLISGGPNNIKKDQTVLPSTTVKTTASVVETMRKLAGIR